MLLIEVASFADAWIETTKTWSKDFASQSHPLRMRGLKPFYGGG